MLITLGMLTACSEEAHRDYAIPSSLCGITVKPNALAPLLPTGSKISTKETTYDKKRFSRCMVSVDGKLAVAASLDWWERKDNIYKVASSYAHIEPEIEEEGGDLLYSRSGGVTKSDDCKDPEFPEQVMFTAVQVYTPDFDDAPAVKRLLKEYTKAAESSGPRCARPANS